MKRFEILSEIIEFENEEEIDNEKFIKKYINLIRKIVNEKIYRKDDREDIVQDCIINLIKNRGSIDYSKNPRSFIINMIHNCIKNIKKGNDNYKSLIFIEDTEDIEEVTYIKEYEFSINDLKKILTNYEFDLIYLYYINGNTYKQIAEKYNIKKQAIHQAINKIMSKLKTKYKKESDYKWE